MFYKTLKKFLVFLLIIGTFNFLVAAEKAQIVHFLMGGTLKTDGRPNAYGKVYLWDDSGKTTEKSAWDNPEKSGTELSMPLTLDVKGAYEVYVDGQCYIEVFDKDLNSINTFTGPSYFSAATIPLVIDILANYGNVADGDTSTGIDLAIAQTTSNYSYEFWFDGTNNQEYVFSANTTFPSNIKIVLFPGAHFTNSAVLTFAGNQIELNQNSYINSTDQVIVSGNIKFGQNTHITNSSTTTLRNTHIWADIGQNIFRGAGSVTGNISNNEIFPEWFGAIKDDSVNDADSIQKCFELVKNNGGIVRLGNGEYTCNSQITGYNKTSLLGSGIDISILNFSGATGSFSNNACLYFAGEGLESLGTLNVAITKNSTFLTLSAEPDLDVGDIIFIYDSSDTSYSSFRSYYRKGEIFRLLSQSSNVLFSEIPLYDSYTTTNVTIYKQNPITCSLKNFTLRGQGIAGNQANIKIVDGYKCVIDSVKSYDSDYVLINLQRNFDSSIQNCIGSDYNPAIGLNYGIQVANSQRILVSNNNYSTTRHSFTIGGGDDVGDIVNREIYVQGNIFSGIGYGGLESVDIHGNSEFNTIIGNQILNGMSICSNYSTILGNTIRSSRQGYGILLGETKVFNATIASNIIHHIADSPTNRGCIDFQIGSGTTDNGNFIIKDNIFEMNNYDGMAIHLWNVASTASLNLVLENNIVNKYDLAFGDLGLTIRSQNGYSFKTLKIIGNILENTGIYCNKSNPEYLLIKDNIITSSNAQGIAISANPTPNNYEHYEIVENTVYWSGSTGISVFGSDEDNTLLILKDNRLANAVYKGTTGTAAADSNIYCANMDSLHIQNNTMGDTRSNQQYLYGLNNINKLYYQDNHDFNPAAALGVSFTDVSATNNIESEDI